MSEITQRVKYQVEFDASGLDRLSALVKEAKAQFDDMGKSAQEVAANFNTLRNAKIKVTHTIKGATAATKGETTAVAEQKAEVEETARAIKELERELAKETLSLKANVRALDENAVLHSKLAQEATKSRVAAKHMAAALGHTNKVVTQFNAGAEKAIVATNNMSKATEKATGSKFMLLQAYAKFFVVKNLLLESFNQIKEGAQNLDITKTLRAQMGNYDKLVADINKSTANTIKEADMNKSIALMSSFGIPADTFARSMELVTKASIRTGQSTDFLAESFARGVSRMSPLILDNLGIQLKLTDAYDAYAAKLGKASDALTKNEQIAAVQNATLAALAETTRGITLEGMAGTAVAQAEKYIADAWLGIQETGAKVLQFLIERHASAETQVRKHADAYQGIAEAIRKLGPEVQAFFEKFGIFGVRDILGGAASAMDVLIEKWEVFGGKVGEYGKGILKNALYGADDPDRARAELDEIVTYLADVQAGKYHGKGMQLTGAAEGKGKGLALGLGLDTLQTEIDVVFAKLNKEISNTLTDEQRITLQKELQAQQRSKEYGLVRMVQESNGDLRRLAQDMTTLDQGRLDILTTMVQKRLEDTRMSNDANRASLAAVNVVQAGVEARERELEFASKTHILSIDANKAYERERGIVAEIAAVRKDYFDDEKVAERGQNKARLEALAIARKIAVTTTEAARKAWELEDERLDKIIKSGKAAVQAEITRLSAIIDQNKALLTQLEIYSKLPGVGGIASLAITQMRNETESAIDSLARLRVEMDSLGKGRGRGRNPADAPDAPYKAPKRKLIDRADAAEYLQAIQTLMRGAQEVLGEKDLFGIIQTKFGVSPELTAEFGDNYRELMSTIKKEFGDVQTFLWRAFKGDEERMKQWMQTYSPMFEYIEGLEKHIEVLREFSDQADLFHTAMASMNDGLAGLGDAFGKDGDNYVNMISAVTGAMQGLTTAIGANAGAYEMLAAGSGLVTGISRNLIKNLRDRAAVEGAMQSALSVAAFASGNIPGAIGHAAAAALFFSVAGAGKAKAADKNKTSGLGGGAGNMNVARSDVHVHIQGTVVQTEAERGMMIQRAIREARAGGR